MKLWVFVLYLFFVLFNTNLFAGSCTAKDVENAVKEIYSLYTTKGHTREVREQVIEKNKNDFSKRCDGLYVYILQGVTMLVHPSPVLDGKPQPTTRDKTPAAHGPAKDFQKELMMRAENQPSGSYVNYVWVGPDNVSLICKSAYVMGVKDPTNPKKVYIVASGYTRNNYVNKGDCN